MGRSDVVGHRQTLLRVDNSTLGHSWAPRDSTQNGLLYSWTSSDSTQAHWTCFFSWHHFWGEILWTRCPDLANSCRKQPKWNITWLKYFAEIRKWGNWKSKEQMLRQFVFRALPVHVSVSRLSIDKWEQKMLRQSQIARQRMNIQHGGIPVNYLPRVRAPLFYLQLSVLNLTCPKFLPNCVQHHCIV